MKSRKLVELLACPENRTPVQEADAALIDKINAAIAAGSLNNRIGKIIDEPIEGGLVREDGKMLYLIRDDIPVMVIDEAIPLEQVS